MGKAIYGCTSCKKTFGRKYNAVRHNIRIHNEMAVIYNRENDWASNKRKVSTNSTSTTAIPNSTVAEDSGAYNNNTISKEIPQKPKINLKYFAISSENDSDIDNDLNRFFKIFEKLMPLVDELDMILRENKDNKERIKILSDTIIQSLMSPNPFKFVKETTRVHRTEVGIVKAYGYIALSENISPEQAKTKLNALAWNTPHLKRNLNSAIF